MNPIRALRRRQLGNRISQRLRVIVRRKYEEVKAIGADRNSPLSRTVLGLSLKDTDSLTPGVMEETIDQLKTFLFAGHDTTSTLINWTLYELHRTPRALEAIRDELRSIFGKGAANPAVVEEKLLSSGGSVIHQMVYISAVIKEVLRLHPPAGSVREPTPGAGFLVTSPDGEVSVDGTRPYLCATIIHRDPSVYGSTVEEFIPERWLEESATKYGPSGIPATAWRPFERGPRSCIGMELANIEARVIVAIVSSRYDFTKEGLGALVLVDGKPVLNDKGQYEVQSELFPVRTSITQTSLIRS